MELSNTCQSADDADALSNAPAEETGSGTVERVAAFTRVTSSFPSEVSKVFELRSGELKKSVSANVAAGHAETVHCRDLAGFGNLLVGLEPNQCLLYGVCETSPVELMTEAAWTKAGRPSGAVSRTEQNFGWADQGGILMLDHDPQPGMKAYRPEDVVNLLRASVPILAEVDMLTWPSASSLIFNADTGDCVKPLKGCRIYLMVEDARAIPALGRYIVEMLWSAGHGVFSVSGAGRLLERGLFDTSVWQPSRIDFAAGAICRPPLEQRRGSPVLHRGSRRHVRSSTGFGAAFDVPELTATQLQAAEAFKAAARATVANEAAAIAKRFAAQQMQKFETAGIACGLSHDLARAKAHAAVNAMLRYEAPELHGAAVVCVVHGDGRHEELSVSEILKRRKELNGAKTLDPMEPEYDGHRAVGKLYLGSLVPRLFSFAHGGGTYKLVTEQGAVELVTGALHQAVDETLVLLRGAGDIYDHGDALTTVSGGGGIIPVTPGLVPYVLSSRIAYYRSKLDPKTGEVQRREVDPPAAVCKSVSELNGQRMLPRLNAVITAPIIVGTRLLDRPGYDEETGLLLVLPHDEAHIELRSSIDDVKQAFTRLQRPFETFPFDTPADRGVFLAALFTAVMRPGLRTAPGFAFDAPAQGTGKSLLTDCVSIIGTGSAPSALPHVHDDEGEVRKRLVSLLYAGAPAMIWDNIKGTFDSVVLASMLTAERFNDRLLGETRLLTLPNRMLALFNGNNMTLRGELTRRILTCRLDARVERPYLRRFKTTPRETCSSERQEIVRDVLTVIRGFQCHGAGFAAGVSLGSFEEWSSAVLRPLLWAAELQADGLVGSPLTKLQDTEDDDEDLQALAALHRAWHECYGETPRTAREVIDRTKRSDFHDWDSEEDEQLHDAISDFVGDGFGRGGPAERARALGRQLSFRKERVVDGRRFVRLKRSASGGAALWVASMDSGQGTE